MTIQIYSAEKDIKLVTWIIIALMVINQFIMIAFMPPSIKIKPLIARAKAMIGMGEPPSYFIYATKVNPDGKTTTVAKWPTITEVPGDPGGDPVEAAKTVMLPHGMPFYAPEGISFDDAVGALSAWGQYEDTISLPPDLQTRWQSIIDTMTCDYCCGGPLEVTIISRCGCAHSKAYRGLAKFLVEKYREKYSNQQILGELQRWKSVWYPKGVVEDYLLATGRGDVLGHENHGGAGPDGRHGL